MEPPAGIEPATCCNSGPQQIAAGSDGNLWFTEIAADRIGKVTTVGAITEFTVPTSGSFSSVGDGFIAAGPDGNLWFTESGATKIGKIALTGTITEYALPANDTYPAGITTGPDGNLWLADLVGNKLIKVTSTPLYRICLLYDPTKATHSGATIPIKAQLCDGSGNDLSSESIIVHAVSITQTSNSISGPVEDSGNSNPDSNFRFDSGIGNTGGYVFNLKTTGLTTGTYQVNFTVTGDSAAYAVPFQVK